MSAGGSAVKNPPAVQETCRRHGFDSWVKKIPWRRKWQPTPVVLPGKSHGQRSLVEYRPWGHRVRHDRGTKPPHVEKYLMTSVEEKKPDMNEKRRVPCM